MASSPEASQPADNNNPSPPADSSTTPPSPPNQTPAPPTTAPPPPSDGSQPPPSDASPPPPSTPVAQPPPMTPEQSPPPPENTNTPPTLESPPALPPPADEGEPVTPPAPKVPRSPPRSSKSGNGSPSPPPPSQKKDRPSSSSDNKELSVILGIIFGGLIVLLLTFVFLKWWRKRKRQQFYLGHGLPIKDNQHHKGPKQQKAVMDPNSRYGVGGYPYSIPSSDFGSGQYPGPPVQSPAPNKMMGSFGGMCEFSYEALAAATNDFSQANVLGQGGFGYVHKGLLPDGTVVAVKSLKAGSGQGEREFQAEVEIISRVHHRYLVTLVGYCIARGQRMLVYEFVPNNTLEFHLHGKDRPVMDWASRRRIAVGSAKGLAYLHEDCHPRIIHRDIKAANILLDNNFEAKVADFGLAKLTTDNYTHVSTRVMGTFGYLAPEYAASGKLTEKSDVYSFGVMLLELITGRRPIDPNNIMEDSLTDWARPLMTKALETGDCSELVDERLKDNYDPQEMKRMIACAAASIRHSARKRPRMSQIVRALDGNSSLDDLNEGVKPGESAAYNPYDTGAYNADIMRFRQMVLSSEDFTSGPNNDYGLTPSPGASSSDSREMGLPGPN